LIVATASFALFARSQENPPPVAFAGPVPAAIFAFSERGTEVKGLGDKISDLLFAGLATADSLWLVDRQELDKVISEHELNLSGMVNPAQAVQIGSLTGAKVLITGSVFQVDKDLHIVAKIIGTETTRVLGASVKGPAKDDISPLVAQLAMKVGETVALKAGLLVAPVVKLEDRIAALNKVLGDKMRPSVTIKVVERHVGQTTIDPAAETELALFFKDSGFTVFDAADAGKADIRIEGEGFSEFGLRRGNLASVKARLEVKAVNPATGEVLAVDRETAVEVDVVEQMAGKKALQSAAARIAERMLPKLVAK
jgi:TolB-like protein